MAGNCSLDLACNPDNGSYTDIPATLESNASRNSGTSNDIYIKETFAILVIKYIILVLLDGFGIIGNVIVVFVTTKRKAFNSSLDLFVKNLAIADLGFLIFIIPSGLVRAEMPFQWPFGRFACLYVYPFLEIFFGSSVWIIAAIAFERYRNIVGMARIHRRESQLKRSARISMFLVWVLSFILYCIPLYVSVDYNVTLDQKICSPRWDSKGVSPLVGQQIYLGLLVLFSYLLPLGIIILTYIAISKQLRRSNSFLRGIRGMISRKNVKNRRQVETTKNNDSDESLRVTGCLGSSCHRPSFMSTLDSNRLTQNKRAKNILTPVAFLFALSMLPINLVRIILLFWTPLVIQPYYRILFFITIFCATANSSMNPLVYSIVSKEFRNALRSIFVKARKSHFRSSTFGFEGRESTDHRRTDFSGIHAGNDSAMGNQQNGSRLFLSCNTKL